MPYAIAAGHDVTADTAEEILKAGGNAIDAAIAAYLASFIAEPFMASGGAGAFALVTLENGHSYVFDFFCQTPRKKRNQKVLDFFPVELDFGDTTEVFHIGHGSVAVPGSIAGIFKLHQRFGTLPMSVLAQPAIQYAKEGVIINRFQADEITLLEEICTQNQRGRNVFMPEGKLLSEGDLIRMPQLADFLDYLSKEGKDAFYRGEVAKKIIEDQKSYGGHLTVEDFENYDVITRKPLKFPYMGKWILTNPLPSIGGPMMGLIANALPQTRSAGQPSTSKHQDELLDAFQNIANLNNDLDQISSKLLLAYPNLVPPGKLYPGSEKRGSTSHFSIVDKNANAVSLTTTIGEGCGYFVEGTDIQLNNMLGEAALMPNGFHSWKENIRLSSMMSPTIVQDKERTLETVLGSGGASRIPYAIFQVLRNLIDFEMPVKTAVDANRIHYHDKMLHLENNVNFWKTNNKHDFEINRWSKQSMFFGGVHTIQKLREKYSAAGDKRRDGVARTDT